MKINEDLIFGESNPTTLHNLKGYNVQTAGTNLDDYQTPGIFGFLNQAYTPINIPAGYYGYLIVLRMNNTTNLTQIWVRNATEGYRDIYMRQWSSSGWSSWVRFLNENDKTEINNKISSLESTIYIQGAAGNSDLNNLTAQGTYYLGGNGNAIHHPQAGLAGWLIVLNYGNGFRIKQIWTRYTATSGLTQTWMRIRSEAEDSWSDWVQAI